MAPSQPLDSDTITRPRTARLAVAAIFFVNGVLVANWFARVPDIKQRLDLSEGTLSLALLAAAIGSLLAQPTTGWVIGRVGSRAVTALMALLFCVVFVLPGLATSLATLMVALALLGAVNGSLDVAMNAQAAIVEKQYERSIMNSFHALWSVGGLGGALLGGLAASNRLPLATHFMLIAGVGALVMLPALRRLVPDRDGKSEHEPAFALPPRVLIPMGIVAFCALLCEGAIGDWSAIYLREGLGGNPGVAAAGYAVFALLMAAGRFTGDWLTTRFGAGRVVRVSGGLLLSGIVLVLVGTTPPVAIAGFGLVGAGVSCIFPLTLSAAARTPGIAPGLGIAAMATAGYTGFLVGPPLIGAVAEAASLRAGLGVLALFGLVVVLLGTSVARASRPHVEPVPG